MTVANIDLNKIDSHADTCCLGKNFILLYYTGEVCNVHAYSDTIASIKDVYIGAGTTVWTEQLNGAEYILEVHQSLLFTETLKHSLLKPNQIRYTTSATTLGIITAPWESPTANSISLYLSNPSQQKKGNMPASSWAYSLLAEFLWRLFLMIYNLKPHCSQMAPLP